MHVCVWILIRWNVSHCPGWSQLWTICIIKTMLVFGMLCSSWLMVHLTVRSLLIQQQIDKYILCVYARMYVLCKYIYIYVCLYVCVSCMCARVHACVCIVCACMSVCMFVYMFVWIQGSSTSTICDNIPLQPLQTWVVLVVKACYASQIGREHPNYDGHLEFLSN